MTSLCLCLFYFDIGHRFFAARREPLAEKTNLS
jgi:hypothetical protein